MLFNLPPLKLILRFEMLELKTGSGYRAMMISINLSEVSGLQIRTTEDDLRMEMSGLSSLEAQIRLKEHGPNQVPFQSEGILRRFLRKPQMPVSWILAMGILVALGFHQPANAAGFALLWLASTLIAFLRESQFQNALKQLYPQFGLSAQVYRDSCWQAIPAAQLVPGDQIQLHPGDRVPADAILLSGQLLLHPSGSSSETDWIESDAGRPVLAGAVVIRGEAAARVTATGTKTRLAQAVVSKPGVSSSPLQETALKLEKLLLILDGLLIGLILAYTSLTGIPLADSLPFALILLSAAVLAGSSEALPLVLARGAQHLWKNGGLVTRLSAIEDLSGLQLMVLDKTGLLTGDSLSIARVQSFPPYSEYDVLHLAAMASDETAQIPEDRVILRKVQAGVRSCQEQRIAYTPYDQGRQISEAIYDEDGQPLRVLKGAPAAILGLIGGDQADIYRSIHALSAQGCRVVVVAVGVAGSLQVAGLLAFQDPPRADSKALIHRLMDMGVKVIMSTSDNRGAARAVALQIGLHGRIYPGDVLCDELGKEIGDYDVIAEMEADQKADLVRVYRRAGIATGITGQGVMDARALKLANVGIALAQAVDAARDAAGLILIRPGLSHLVDAISASRQVTHHMLASILMPAAKIILLVSFMGLGLFFTGILLLPPLLIAVLLAAHQLDGLVSATEWGSTSARPDRRQAPRLGLAALYQAVPFLALSGAVYGVGRYLALLPASMLETLVFIQLFFSGQALLYLARDRRSLWNSPPGKALLLSSAVQILAVSGITILGIILTPLSLVWVAILFGLNALALLLFDFIKARG